MRVKTSKNRCKTENSRASGTKNHINHIAVIMEQILEKCLGRGSGPFLKGKSHFEKIEAEFYKGIRVQSTGEIVIAEKVQNCKSEGELIALLSSYFSWSPIPPEEEGKQFQKSGDTSTAFRSAGNLHYQRGEGDEALKCYNLAIAFAPFCDKSPELALAFGNRSALFLQRKQYESALTDIDCALRHNFPDELTPKLEERRGKCLQLLKDLKQKKGSELEEYFEETYFKLKSPNEAIIGAEDFLEIDISPEKGRRLMTKKKLSPGTVILVDKPFVSVNNNLLSWEFSRCAQCYQKLTVSVPCTQCTFTMYCNETCRDRSCSQGGLHAFEHAYLPYLVMSKSPLKAKSHKELQALRLLGKLGPSTLLKLHKLQATTGVLFPPAKGSPKGSDPSGAYDPSNYSSVYHLISHGLSKNTSVVEKVADCFLSLFLTHMLKTTSNFFQDHQNSLDFEHWVASLLLRHLGSIRFNAIAVSELVNDDKKALSFATGLYPLIALSNHSCDPNLAPVKRSQGLETALLALTPIEAGEELTLTYKPLWALEETQSRQSFLRENYKFVCDCRPCRSGWSSQSIIQTDDLESLNVTVSLETLVKLDSFEGKLYEAADILKGEDKDLQRAIKLLVECLEYFKAFGPRYALYQVNQELFKRALVKLVKKVES